MVLVKPRGGGWQEINLNEFNINIGNTSAQINSFTEANWKDFDMLHSQSANLFYKREIKIAALLSHDVYSKTPIINKINIWCYLPTEALGIATNKYTVIHSYDKYEIKWDDVNKTSLMIFYE